MQLTFRYLNFWWTKNQYFFSFQLECCGMKDDASNGFKDWNSNAHFNCAINNTSPERCSVPFSCCKRKVSYHIWLFSFSQPIVENLLNNEDSNYSPLCKFLSIFTLLLVFVTNQILWILHILYISCWNTNSHTISEVKQPQVWLLSRWVAAWEYRVV